MPSSSVTAQAFSSIRPAAVVLEVEFALDADGRSAPLRYGELAAALDAEPDPRADPTRVREAVLSLRAGKGMVLDEADHDTWSVGSFFTNPVVTPAEFERLQDRVDGPVPNYPAPDGVKLAAGWLVERAGFGKGYPGRRCTRTAVHQACAGADQPRQRHHRGRDCAGQDGAGRCRDRHSGSNSHPSRF